MSDLLVSAAPSLRKQVVDMLRNAVASGELEPGERRVERVLCERIGVSRTSLREALRELENEGLVTNLPNRGLIISPLDPKIARNIFDVRASLEALICRLFCECATDEQLELCRAAFDDLKAAYSEGVARNMIEAKTRFYDILMIGADNVEAERMLRSIHIRVSQLRILSLSEPKRRAASIIELEALIEALLNRDAAKAERLSKAHVNKAAVSALSKFTAR